MYRGINIVGPNSEYGLRAGLRGRAQHKLWQMVDELYARQGAGEQRLDQRLERSASAAKAAGANVNAISAAFLSAPVTTMWRSAERAATTYGVRGTPTFVVQRPPALPTQLQLSALDPAAFSAALDPLLQ